MMLTSCLVLTLLAPTAEPPVDHHPDNVVFKDLTTKGFKVGPDLTYNLPEPWMPDGLTAEKQKEILEARCKGVGSLKSVLKRGDYGAPIYFKDPIIKDSNPEEPSYAVNMWFVAYGDLDKMAKDKPTDLFSSNPGKPESKQLTDEDLKARNITWKFKELPLQERWTHTKSVLEDRIKLSVTTHTVISRSAESLIIATTLDPAFATDKDFPNTWDRIKPLAAKANQGAVTIGGYYLKITKLVEPKDALFVEIHEVTSEPKVWFSGDPILRSHFQTWATNEPKNFRVKAFKTLPNE